MGPGQASRRNRDIRRYHEVKIKGICAACRKRKARKGRVTCQICENKRAKYRKNAR